MNTLINCLIVDDEPIAHQILKNYIDKDDRLALIGNCNSAMEALQFLNSHSNVDLIFLDIKMPKISGLEMLSSLRNPPLVIITTANREFALESFDLNAIDYLLKPFSFERFLQAINKIFVQTKINLESSLPVQSTKIDGTFIIIKVDGKIVKVFHADILLIEAWKEYVKVYTSKKVHVTYISFSSIIKKLPESIFYKTHRSFVVNINKISQLDGNIICIKDYKVPVSRNEKYGFLQRFTNRQI
ncbi:MAG: DNA-binding response regulator [Cytophagales bacterium]|nr:MAG: DNA-binding response regulator [Cytophagales bacterium]